MVHIKIGIKMPKSTLPFSPLPPYFAETFFSTSGTSDQGTLSNQNESQFLYCSIIYNTKHPIKRQRLLALFVPY